MTEGNERTTCAGFAEQLASYLEGELLAPARVEMDAHAAACASCGALLADLGAIRREAAALPALEPLRDLWAGIAARIEAPVAPFETARAVRVPPRRAWTRPSLAAAALVLVTAGVTHVLTRVSYRQAATVPAITRRPTQVAQVLATQNQRNTPNIAAPSAPDAVVISTVNNRAGMTAPRNGAIAPLASSRVRTGAHARLVSAEPVMKETQPAYDREVGKLRTIVNERRSQLDPTTVAVLEQSIAVIDSAIAQSRAALAGDPASGFLATQLNRSLEKKVELLRTTALLPSRT